MAVLREIRSRKAIYLPLFIGLALSAAQSIGMQAWRAPFMIRTYGWNEAQIGRWMGLMFLVSSLLGATLGTRGPASRCSRPVMKKSRARCG